jgi:hypothetical protein
MPIHPMQGGSKCPQECFVTLAILLSAFSGSPLSQDPTGVVEGQVCDNTGGAVSGSAVFARNLQTGYTLT